GHGGFGTPRTFAPQIGLNAQLLRIADAQGDGRGDLLAAFTPFGTAYSARFVVLLQNQAGGFDTVDTSLAALRGIDGFVITDLNSDGRPDLASTGFFPVGSPTQVRSNTNVLLHAEGASYRAPAVYSMPSPMVHVDAADLDGDGRIDLVLLGSENRAFVMRQSPDAPGTFLAPEGL
ncbi:MAG: VCBS repeat-containing protein, partial [Burkholderiales bacterium]